MRSTFADWFTTQKDRPGSVGRFAKELTRIDRATRARTATPGEVWKALGGGRRGKQLRDAIHVARLEYEVHSGKRPKRP